MVFIFLNLFYNIPKFYIISFRIYIVIKKGELIMDRVKIFNKTKLFSIFSLMLFIFIFGDILYSQASANLIDSFTNLPNSRRLANNIAIRSINEDSLYVEWEGIHHPNLTYYVYRSVNPILSRPLLTTATIIGSVKATNNANSYSMLDILPGYGTYYYAVISYVDNIGFYTADSDVDTVSFEFKDPNAPIITNTNAIAIGTNDLAASNLSNGLITNAYSLTNFTAQTNYYQQTNYYVYTNYHNITNYYNATEIYIKPEETNISNNPIKGGRANETNLYTNENLENLNESLDLINTNALNNALNNNEEIPPAQSDFDRYTREYDRAVEQFKDGNYSTVISILEPISRRNVDRTLYYNINLLLGKSYKNTNQKQNALNVFRRIQSINSAEVGFWVNQVLSDL